MNAVIGKCDLCINVTSIEGEWIGISARFMERNKSLFIVVLISLDSTENNVFSSCYSEFSFELMKLD